MKTLYGVLIEQGKGEHEIVVDGISWKENVRIFLNFDITKTIGRVVNIEKKDGKIYADLEVKEFTGKLFPAIGGMIIEEIDEVTTEFKINSLGLCDGRNEDETIPSIKYG